MNEFRFADDSDLDSETSAAGANRLSDDGIQDDIQDGVEDDFQDDDVFDPTTYSPDAFLYDEAEEDSIGCDEIAAPDNDDFDYEFDKDFETLPDDEFNEIIDGEDEAEEEETSEEPSPCVAETEDEFGDFDDFNADEDAFIEEDSEDEI